MQKRKCFPAAYRTSTDIADFAALDHIIESLHDLFARGVAVQTVDLEHIDIGTQTLDASVNGIEDVLARQTDSVDEVSFIACGFPDGREFALVIDPEIALGHDDHTVAGNVELLQGFTNDFFGATVGIDIGLCYTLTEIR